MVKATIRLYWLLAFLVKLGMSFIAATYVTFLIAKGLNLFEVNLTNFVFFATLFIFEVPTGAVADVFGRKISFVISCFILSAGMFLYAISGSFWQFAVAEAIAAIGATFMSGAFQAWMVDRLKHHGHNGSLNLVFARSHQIAQAAGIGGAMAGAFLSDFNIALPWVVGGVVLFAAGTIAAVFMKEEYFVRQKFSMRSSFESMKDTVRSSVRYGLKNKAVRFVLLIGTVQFFAVQAPNMQWQPFFSEFLPDKASLGFVFAGISVFLIIGAAMAQWFSKRMKNEKKTMIVSQVIVGLGVALAGIFGSLPVALSIFLIHEAARGFFRPIKDTYFNEHIPSKERATLISFESITHHLGGMVGLLVSGFVAEQSSIPAAWILSGAVLIGAVFMLARNNRRKKA